MGAANALFNHPFVRGAQEVPGAAPIPEFIDYERLGWTFFGDEQGGMMLDLSELPEAEIHIGFKPVARKRIRSIGDQTIRHAFGRGAERVWARIHTHNTPALRIADRWGFTARGIFEYEGHRLVVLTLYPNDFFSSVEADNG